MDEFEQIINEVEANIEKPFVTARFGRSWKIQAKEYDKQTIIEIAWKQGRRAILLEREIKRLLGKIWEEKCS